jgi:hypothetical protein
VSAALDLLGQFEAIGAKVEDRAGRLVLRPGRQSIPPAMVAAAKLVKSELLATLAKGRASGSSTAEPPIENTAVNRNEPEPLLLADGRRLWRFRAEIIPAVLNDQDIRPAVEARWCGCVLGADGHELIVVEPWLTMLPPDTLCELRARAGEVIAALRRQSRVRCAGREQIFEPRR